MTTPTKKRYKSLRSYRCKECEVSWSQPAADPHVCWSCGKEVN